MEEGLSSSLDNEDEEDEAGDEPEAAAAAAVAAGKWVLWPPARAPWLEKEEAPKEDCPSARSLPTPMSLILQTYWFRSLRLSKTVVEEGGREGGVEDEEEEAARRMLWGLRSRWTMRREWR